MKISEIKTQQYFYSKNQLTNKPANNRLSLVQEKLESGEERIPIGYRYGANVTFKEFFDPNRTVPHIDYEEYMAMRPHTKQRFRIRYATFDKTMNRDEMFDKKAAYLPLRSEKNMEEFIETSKIYSKYKDQPIICLGRSPKWFLNAALWMKDGIDDYKFVAFSKFWYWPDKKEGVRKMSLGVPTEKEVAAYRKYLKRIKADPKTIVDNFEKTGKKTVLTDYISTGKGMTSFLDLMADYADDLGILEKFSKSIQIVGIGSLKHLENSYHDDEEYSIPKVYMPEKLIKYSYNVKQEFYDMYYPMFAEMLLNQNTNECRSTYYPHEAWTVYKPDKFKTGLVTDMKKVKQMIKEAGGDKAMFSSFTPAMYDYRNLLNFRILDALNHRKLLKTIHKSKV